MAEIVSYQRAAVQPIECLSAGFALMRDRYWLLFGISAVGMLIGSVFPLILLGPMMCGVYLVLFEHIRGRPIQFGMLFKGFDYFVNSLIATLLFFVPMLLLIVPFYIFFMVGMISLAQANRGGANRPPPEIMGSFFGLCVLLFLAIGIISMVIGVVFAFAYPLIVERRLSAIEAVKLSIKAGFANFWRLLGLMVLNGLLGLVGAIFCYVGAFFIMPVQFAALATAYRQVFGLIQEQGTAPPLAPAVPPVV